MCCLPVYNSACLNDAEHEAVRLGTLSQPESALREAHLLACGSCQQRHEELAALRRFNLEAAEALGQVH